MAIAFHASSTNTGSGVANGGTFAITKPTVSAGDVLVLAVGLNNGSASTTSLSVNTPSGWTLAGANIFQASGSAAVAVQLFTALQSVSGLTFTVSCNNPNTGFSWVCASFSGVDNTTPQDAAGTGNKNTGSATISVATFNTVTDQALEVFVVCDWNTGTFTQASFTVLESALTNVGTGLLYANAATHPAGATGAFTVTDSASATGQILCYQQAALRPVSGATVVDEDEGIRYVPVTIW